MKKLRIALTALLLLAFVVACISCDSNTSTVTPTPTPTPIAGIDDEGRPFEFATPPQRIVSHVPSITETLFALGLDDRIVAVSDYCDYPEEAKTKPKIGGYWTPNIEAIVAMNPDMVLTDGLVDSIRQLESLGIPYVVLQPKDFNGIFQDIRLLGYITATGQRGEQIISDMQACIDAVVSTIGNSTRPRVFYAYEASNPTMPWTAGPGSFIDALINLAGGENVAGNASGPWVQFNMEGLVDSDPEIILLNVTMGTATISPEALKELPGWKDSTAVKEERVYTINADLVDRSGPRIVQGLEDIAKAIHPELFAH